MEPRALLISLRDPSDAMCEHERRCFADQARLPDANVVIHAMQEGIPDRGKIKGYDAVFFGGSGAYSVLDDVQWIRDGIATLLTVAELRIPTWASCFGFQGLAVALGGTVVRDDAHAEMGSTWIRLTAAGKADPLLSGLAEGFWAQEGHHDRVVGVPKGVTLVAEGDFVTEQAFRIDGAPFWASQFHPELTVASTIERFKFYQKHYVADEGMEELLHKLETGPETPALSTLLPRLVRREF
jgi:GMP synthase (glutamine-hydrolysing)